MSSDRQDGMEGVKEIIPVVQIELKHLLTLPSTCEVTPTSAPLIYYYCEL